MRWRTLNSTRLVTETGPNAVVASPGVRNMYGCLPCHRCGAGYRYALLRDNMIHCDDCGHKQPAEFGSAYIQKAPSS